MKPRFLRLLVVFVTVSMVWLAASVRLMAADVGAREQESDLDSDGAG
jgi:hypothetical protein